MLDIVGELKQNGIAIVSGDELLGGGTCDHLNAYLVEFALQPAVRELQESFERGEVRQNVLKPHMVKTDQVGFETTYLSSVGNLPIVRSIVDGYLGSSRMVAANGWWFFPRPYDRKRVWSESWHRDPEAGYGGLVKAFYWPEAVDSESGPMQFIPASGQGGPLESLCAPKRYPECDVDALVHPSAIVTCEVPARTFMFVCTDRLHRGGYTKSKGRLCATWCYVKAGAQ